LIRHLVATATSLSAVLAASAMLGVLTWAPDARAVDDRGDILTGRHRRAFESPQRWALEFRGLLYAPNIDSDSALGNNTPYKDTFGTMKRLAVQLEVDYQAVRIPHLGTLGPGIGVGFTEMSNNTYILGHPDEPAKEQTSLDIYPMYLVAVLRADVLKRELKIPLVPYVKGGLGLALWRASNDAGTSTFTQTNGTTVKGEGHTFGTELAAGLMFNIDVFDPVGAGNLDQSTGINNTYIFAEYYDANLTGIGQSHPLLVGSSGWAFGLTVEF
jgi:hypothetical protein